MSKPKTNGRTLGQDARMVMHEDEHAIVEQILSKTLGDDDCFAKVVSRDRSESGRAEDRLGLARFLDALFRVLYDTPAITRADGATSRESPAVPPTRATARTAAVRNSPQGPSPVASLAQTFCAHGERGHR